MKTLTTLVRRAAARWALKHRNTRQAQPEQDVPEGHTIRETADSPVPEKRGMDAATGPSEQAPAANRQAVSGIVDMERRLKAFLADRYRFRYNLLTGMTEFMERHAFPEGGESTSKDKETIPENKERNPKDRETNSEVARTFTFRPLTARAFNTICLAAHEAGIGCWDRDLLRHVESGNVAEFHPFRAYFAVLPAWDGQDRITDLARRVSDSPLWIEGFHRWLLAAAAQWTGYAGPLHANAVAPLLVSTAQGLGKSAFCRALLPPELRDYFTDHVDLTASAALERKLTTMGLISLDEFDRIGERRQPLLKNLMQLTSLNYRKAYSRHAEALPRIASFIGTSNSHELLTDPTGSRRFLCVEVTHPIDCSGMAYEQIYAQLKAELEAGDRYWFTGEEEERLRLNNLRFYRIGPVEDVFRRYFRAARPDEEVRPRALTDLMEEIRRRQPHALRGVNIQMFARAVMAAGVERRHTREGNRYRVMAVETGNQPDKPIS